jgi:hypothetical protein
MNIICIKGGIMMATKKEQHKAGAPEKPRGQEMGRGQDRDQNREAQAETPALRGERKDENEFFADKSSQHVGTDNAKPRSNTPSIPAALPSEKPLGQSGGEQEFKRHQEKK